MSMTERDVQLMNKQKLAGVSIQCDYENSRVASISRIHEVGVCRLPSCTDSIVLYEQTKPKIKKLIIPESTQRVAITSNSIDCLQMCVSEMVDIRFETKYSSVIDIYLDDGYASSLLKGNIQCYVRGEGCFRVAVEDKPTVLYAEMDVSIHPTSWERPDLKIEFQKAISRDALIRHALTLLFSGGYQSPCVSYAEENDRIDVDTIINQWQQQQLNVSNLWVNHSIDIETLRGLMSRHYPTFDISAHKAILNGSMPKGYKVDRMPKSLAIHATIAKLCLFDVSRLNCESLYIYGDVQEISSGLFTFNTPQKLKSVYIYGDVGRIHSQALASSNIKRLHIHGNVDVFGSHVCQNEGCDSFIDREIHIIGNINHLGMLAGVSSPTTRTPSASNLKLFVAGDVRCEAPFLRYASLKEICIKGQVACSGGLLCHSFAESIEFSLFENRLKSNALSIDRGTVTIHGAEGVQSKAIKLKQQALLVLHDVAHLTGTFIKSDSKLCIVITTPEHLKAANKTISKHRSTHACTLIVSKEVLHVRQKAIDVLASSLLTTYGVVIEREYS